MVSGRRSGLRSLSSSRATESAFIVVPSMMLRLRALYSLSGTHFGGSVLAVIVLLRARVR